MAAIAEILKPTPEGVDIKREVYGQGGAQTYEAEGGTVVVRGETKSAEVWRRRIPTTLRPGDDPIEIKLLDGSTLRVTAADNYQSTE